MRRLFFALGVALLVGLILARAWAPQPMEQRLIGVQLEALVPAHAERLQHEPIEVQEAVLSLAQQDDLLAAKAQAALRRYGDLAREVLPAYAEDVAFRHVLQEYGEQVVPPIHYFMHNDLPSLSLYKRAGDTASALLRLWNDEQAVSPEPLTADGRGHFAIRFIAEEGHGFLGQFVIAADGSVVRVQTERVTEGVVGFFTGGIRDLETRWRRGDEIAASDVGWAAVDVAIAASAVKLLRLGRGAAAARSTAASRPATAALGSTLLRGSRVGVQIARIGGPVALAYVVVHHPSLLNSAFGQVAEWLGYPVWVVQTLGWGLVLLPVLLLLQWLLRPLALLFGAVGGLLRWCDRCVRGRTA